VSHFTVLVIGKDVEKQLAPYHEFECTGDDDEYVQDIDETEELRKEYESSTVNRMKSSTGELEETWGDKFFRDPTKEESEKIGIGIGSGYVDGIEFYSKDWKDGKGYRPKVRFEPEGWTKVTLPRKEIESFAEFCSSYHGHHIVPFGEQPDLKDKHKYGYTLVDANGEVVKAVDRTNPNRKWDWYQIGGRWNGFFKLKHPFRIAIDRAINGCDLTPRLGSPGANRLDADYKPPTADRADQCLKSDIDIDGMRHDATMRAEEKYDLYTRTVAGLPEIIVWDVIRDKHKDNIEAARDEYNGQPGVRALRANDETMWEEPKDFMCTRDEYIERARNGALATFAVVKDGKWYERGDMGWFGVVSDEKDENDWLSQFSSLVDSLPNDTLLTIVDAHT